MAMKRILRAAVVSLGLAASTFACAEEQADVMGAHFSAPITVSAGGQPTIGEIHGVQGRLAEAVRLQLQALQYVPARREGTAVDQITHLSGTAVLTPLTDGTFDVRVLAALEPKMAASEPPLYPEGLARRDVSGGVELVLRVGADGRIDEVRTVASSHRDFDRAVRQAVRRWRFAPRPGADAIEVAVPVWFHVGGEISRPRFQCTLDPGRAHVAGQSGCLDLFEIAAFRD